MKRILALLIIGLCVYAFAVVGRAMMTRPITVQAAQAIATNTEYQTPTLIPTNTPIPSPTIGYEMTLQIAQATADEARRVNAEVTAAHESFLLSQMQLTADAEKRAQEIIMLTAQAGPTMIPLTAAMQVVINTQIAQGQLIQLGALTATKEAPTQISAMARSHATVRYAELAQISNVVGVLSVSALCIAFVVFLARRWNMPEAKEVEPQTETVVQMRRDNGQGGFSQVRLVVPCSPEQLTELAEMAVNGEKRFGINRLETHSRTFKAQRETILAVRQFLIDSGLVVPDSNGMITLNANGEQFLTGWFDAHKLPDDYEFAPPPPHLHEHDTHTHDEKPAEFTRGGAENLSGGASYTQEGKSNGISVD